jgi:HK97 family phage portal protein
MGVFNRLVALLGIPADKIETKAVSIQRQRDGIDEDPPFYEIGAAQMLANYTQVTGLDSNVIMAPVAWIMRTFVEAIARVQRRVAPDETGQLPTWQPAIDHAAELLLAEPNEFYDGDMLWQGTLVSFVLAGNAYWQKVRDDLGEPRELWYLPHWMVTPKYPGDGSRYIDYYDYRPLGSSQARRIPVRDIVHFRFGLDPRDTRMGISPLRPLLREVTTDDEAAIFSAAILQNMGVPGLLISPKDGTSRPSKADVDELREFMDTRTTRLRRGKTVVFGTPTDIAQFGFDPNQLTLANLRDISEERVCAMLGLPAPVVGFGSGMQATKVGATMREFVKLAWVQCLSPIQTSLARQVTRQLLTDFVSQTRRYRIKFDLSEVAGFQEDDNQAAERAVKLVTGGILRVDRAQAMLGLEVDDTQKVYLRPSTSTPVDDQGNVIEPPQRTVAPPVDGQEGGPPPSKNRVAEQLANGNGTGAAAD